MKDWNPDDEDDLIAEATRELARKLNLDERPVPPPRARRRIETIRSPLLNREGDEKL